MNGAPPSGPDNAAPRGTPEEPEDLFAAFEETLPVTALEYRLASAMALLQEASSSDRTLDRNTAGAAIKRCCEAWQRILVRARRLYRLPVTPRTVTNTLTEKALSADGLAVRDVEAIRGLLRERSPKARLKRIVHVAKMALVALGAISLAPAAPLSRSPHCRLRGDAARNA